MRNSLKYLLLLSGLTACTKEPDGPAAVIPIDAAALYTCSTAQNPDSAALAGLWLWRSYTGGWDTETRPANRSVLLTLRANGTYTLSDKTAITVGTWTLRTNS